MRYELRLHVDIVDPETGEKEDYQVDEEYYPTQAEAQAEAGRHYVGEVVGVYEDGAEGRISMIEVDEIPDLT